MLCKPHKVCISLWPMGWDDVKAKEQNRPSRHFVAPHARKTTEVLWYIFLLTSKQIEKKLYTKWWMGTNCDVLTRKCTKRIVVNDRVHVVSWNSVTRSIHRSSWIV